MSEKENEILQNQIFQSQPNQPTLYPSHPQFSCHHNSQRCCLPPHECCPKPLPPQQHIIESLAAQVSDIQNKIKLIKDSLILTNSSKPSSVPASSSDAPPDTIEAIQLPNSSSNTLNFQDPTIQL